MIAVIAVVAVVAIAGIGVGVWALTKDSSDGGNFTIDGNGGKTSDDKTSFIKDASAPLAEDDLLAFFYPGETKGASYFTANADGTGKKYYAGDKVPAGTTVYCKWNPKLASITDTSFDFASAFQFTDGDRASAAAIPVVLGVTTFDNTVMVGKTDNIEWTGIADQDANWIMLGGTIKGEDKDIKITFTDATIDEAIFVPSKNSLTIPLKDIGDGFSIKFEEY